MFDTQEDSLVLVVDDTPANLEIISETLTDAGIEVAIASDGERALKQLQYRLPDLILLDVMMPPGIDGFETCRRLKQNSATCDIPVIFMTAISDTDNKVKGLNLGAVDYITKPFEEQEVLARVSIHLKLRNLNKELEQRVAERTIELTNTLEQLKQFQLQLVHNEKMSTLGNLIAGVAHEINNPVGFIAGNLQPTVEYVQDLFRLIELYQKYYPKPVVEITKEIAAIDLEYLREDLPKLLTTMEEGVNRIENISTSLRTFSRSDAQHKITYNIHDGIDSTILILKHRLYRSGRREIQVVKDYGDLPEVKCFPGQLNQVFMNLLSNAIDAIEDFVPISKGQIWISTELSLDSESVLIRIKDNGAGMSEDVRQKAFENLFTTKPVGKGTGLGLAISSQIVVEKHGGSLSVNSLPGQGSEFIITIPIN